MCSGYIVCGYLDTGRKPMVPKPRRPANIQTEPNEEAVPGDELFLYRTQGAEGSWPAMKIRRSEDVNKRYKITEVNVRMNVMYNKCE
jgi:hypothetical protein